MPRLDILEKKDLILQWIEEERPKNYICQQLKCKSTTLNSYLKKMGIEYKGQQSKKGQQKGSNVYRPANYYFDNKHPIPSTRLKDKLFKDGLKEQKCEICGVSKWQGIQLPLELHHKNNDHTDNSFENLQILCPNCHSIQPGNSGANINKYVAVLESADNTHLECVPEKGVGSSPTSNTNWCIDCNKPISKNAIRCKSCASKFRQQSGSPEREVLKDLIRNNSFTSLGKKFNVSDNAVRKWCKSLNLPYQSTKIKQFSDEEWENI